jgi:hypothetical protein
MRTYLHVALLIVMMLVFGGLFWSMYHDHVELKNVASDLFPRPIGTCVNGSESGACTRWNPCSPGATYHDMGGNQAYCWIDEVTEFVPDLPRRMCDGIIHDSGTTGCPICMHADRDGDCQLDRGYWSPHPVVRGLVGDGDSTLRATASGSMHCLYSVLVLPSGRRVRVPCQ